MKTFSKILLFLAISSFTLIACKKNCEDDCVKIKKGIRLTGAQEVPQRETTAKGTADVSYNKCTKELKYTISWKDLSGIPTGAHIHGTAPRGMNAGVKHNFFPLIPKTMSGTFTNSVTVDDVAIKADSLLAGFYYFNFHTPKFPGGEIRGQIEF
ncbi:MAG: CHRD domain-containing protein [Ferruginibacter sp.]